MTESKVQEKPTGSLLGLTVGATGIVYGDIGTSPLYAFRESLLALTKSSGQMLQPYDVIGLVSLLLWTLMLVVTLKYVFILLKVDNQGEGGPLALMALVRSAFYRHTLLFMAIGMASAAFFYGDALITPAISVLSAVEGMKVVTPSFEPYIVPLSLVIIFCLFFFQSHGTGRVSTLFGPVMLLWFFVLAGLGFWHIGDQAEILYAFNPAEAISFLLRHPESALISLGAVFLGATGAEALYADLGHFGRTPIQAAWIWLVFPALALNYLGQGALVLKDPSLMGQPFFQMAPTEWQPFLVVFATVATIIASQSVITGAFSLTRQAVTLGLLPRLTVKYTSDVHSGQIYMPQVNYLLMFGVLIVILLFRSSDALSAAYGLSVTGTMFLTSIMVFFVVWKIWDWPAYGAALFTAPLVAIDSIFLFANGLKILDGGWMPLLVAGVLLTIMGVWVRGMLILNRRSLKRDIRLDKFLRTYKVQYGPLQRVPGTAFFMVGDPALTPPSLVQNLRHNHVLHETNIIMAVQTEQVPYVDAQHRSLVTRLNDDFSLLVMRFGFKEIPDVQEELLRLNHDVSADLSFDWHMTSVFLNRRFLRAHKKFGMPLWQDWILIWLHKNSSDPSDYYRLPLGRVIEIGRHVLI